MKFKLNDYAGDHAWWANKNHFEPHRPNMLMKVE